MIIVLDTNVLVSGLLKGASVPGSIVRSVLSAKLTLRYDFRIIQEYTRVLNRPKFDFDKTEINAVLQFIETEGIMISAPPLAIKLPDPEDKPFLEVAATRPNVPLVTGNLKHYAGGVPAGVTVITPAELLAMVATQKGFNPL